METCDSLKTSCIIPAQPTLARTRNELDSGFTGFAIKMVAVELNIDDMVDAKEPFALIHDAIF